MKAALEAWGAGSKLFHQGLATETRDRKIIAAAMAKPGTVLQRPVGSTGSFGEHAHLPTIRSLLGPSSAGKLPSRKQKTQKARAISEEDARKAAITFEQEHRRRELQRRKEETAAAKAHSRRQAAMSKAEAALERGRRQHEAVAAKIEKDRATLQRRADAEDMRWEKQRKRLQAARHKASS